MEQELLKLGLTHNQSKVYLALLELGQTTVGPIIRKTNLPRQTVYNTLAELKSENLVFSIIKSGRTNWQAKAPQQILENLNLQKQLAEKLLPQLLAKRDMAKHSAEITVYEGMDGYKTMHLVNLKNQSKNSTVNIIGSETQKWIGLAERGGFFNKYENMRLAKNIGHRIIACKNQRSEIKQSIEKYYLKQPPTKRKKFRFLPEDIFSLFCIQIWQDRIELIIFYDYPIVFEIKSMQLVKNFENQFKFLWNLAKE